MPRQPADNLFLTMCAAIVIGCLSAAVAVTRIPVRAVAVPRVLAEQATPAPPAATTSPAPTPDNLPRVAAPRSGAVRTSGSTHSGPRPTDGWIEIPSIGARAPIVAVGLDAKGAMVTPRNARDVAWLDNGTFPGPTRNAVLAGHRNYSGRAGTFERLENVHPGDTVKVSMDGRTYTFSIVWVRTFDPNNAPVEELLGNTQADSLTMVTCGGSFNRRIGHYDKRVVARAELVGPA